MKWLGYKCFFCVLKTRTLEICITLLVIGLQCNEDSNRPICPGEEATIKIFCDSVVMRVMFLRLTQTNVPQGCLGRTGTPPVSLQFKGQSQARKHGNVVTAGTARFNCFTVYTYSIIFVVFHCFVKFTYKEEKNIDAQNMVINICFHVCHF